LRSNHKNLNTYELPCGLERHNQFGITMVVSRVSRQEKPNKQIYKEEEVMKKVLMVVFVLLIGVVFVSSVFAQAKPEAKPAIPV